MDAFTDEILAPTRTTRPRTDPVEHRMEVFEGDELLVDVSAYVRPELGGCLLWCRVVTMAPGSASVYPYKVAIPDAGVGQFRASEVLGWRRPLGLHRALREYGALAEKMA